MENLLCAGPQGNRIKSVGSPVTGLWDPKASCALGGTHRPHCMLGNCSILSYIPNSEFQAFEHVFKSFYFPDSFTSPDSYSSFTIQLTNSHDAFSGSLW